MLALSEVFRSNEEMRLLYALHGILSPFPQRPLCVVGRGWGEGKMKVRRGWGEGGEGGRGRGGNAVPLSIVHHALAFF